MHIIQQVRFHPPVSVVRRALPRTDTVSACAHVRTHVQPASPKCMQTALQYASERAPCTSCRENSHAQSDNLTTVSPSQLTVPRPRGARLQQTQRRAE